MTANPEVAPLLVMSRLPTIGAEHQSASIDVDRELQGNF
jgi:hypothetical protein